MKGLIAITLLAVCLAGCSSHQYSAQADTSDHSNTVELLTNSFTSAKVQLSGRQINAEIMWLTSTTRMRHSRPSDIFLPETDLSAFVMPILNLTMEGPSLKDVTKAVQDKLKSFLKKNRIHDVRVLTMEEMREDTEQNKD